MRNNPFELVYTALWEMLDRSPNLSEYIKPRNKITFNSPTMPKPVISEGDLPEIAWMPSGAEYNIRSNSSSTEVIRSYTLAVTSNLSLPLYDKILWECMRAMVDWDVVLCRLEWPEDRHFIVQSTLSNIEEGLMLEEKRGIAGWTGLLLLKVQMSFSTQSMRITSQEFGHGD